MTEDVVDISRSPVMSLNSANDQHNSPLFRLPSELRDMIWKLTFSSRENAEPSNGNDRLCHLSPCYLEPQELVPGLAQTCKKIYQESWLSWWSAAQHTLWIDTTDQGAKRTTSLEYFARMLEHLAERHGIIELERVRFVAQSSTLEYEQHSSNLRDLLANALFNPVIISITIRHTDWFDWAGGSHLHIDGAVASSITLPLSARKVNLELEALNSRQDQLDSIIAQMREKWYFTKTDGSLLSARRTQVLIERWKGSSTWAGKRWARDESDPEWIHYYIATVMFEHEHDLYGKHSSELPDLDQTVSPPYGESIGPVLDVRDLIAAQVPRGTDGVVAYRMICNWLAEQAKETRKNHQSRGVWSGLWTWLSGYHPE